MFKCWVILSMVAVEGMLFNDGPLPNFLLMK